MPERPDQLRAESVSLDTASKYRTIVADPPWQYQKAKQDQYQRGAAENHYPTMQVSEIAALPVEPLAADDAHLYLWVTNKILTEQRVDGTALQIVRAWGFEAKALLTWVKPQIGMGYYYRGCTEHVLFATRGRLPVPPSKRERNAFTAGRTRHSAKPPCFYEMVERVSPGPYLEMFARQPRGGWDVWGDEVNSTVEVAAMNPYPAGSEIAAIWQLGYDEADGDIGMTYDDDPESPRSVAYDEGRNAGEGVASEVPTA